VCADCAETLGSQQARQLGRRDGIAAIAAWVPNRGHPVMVDRNKLMRDDIVIQRGGVTRPGRTGRT
jgi:hypothetical protein